MNRNWSRIRRIQAIVLITMILSATAFAAPEWRGTGGTTTFQEWSFDVEAYDSVPADTSDNQYGSPVMWVDDRAVYGNGAWGLSRYEMDFQIPNNPVSPPESMKEMFVELTWREADLSFLPPQVIIAVTPEGHYDRVTIEPGPDIPFGDWKKTIYKINIWPNPAIEWVTIKGDVYLDEVVIDTRCIPEPATLGLLIGGAFMAIRRRRKI